MRTPFLAEKNFGYGPDAWPEPPMIDGWLYGRNHAAFFALEGAAREFFSQLPTPDQVDLLRENARLRGNAERTVRDSLAVLRAFLAAKPEPPPVGIFIEDLGVTFHGVAGWPGGRSDDANAALMRTALRAFSRLPRAQRDELIRRRDEWSADDCARSIEAWAAAEQASDAKGAEGAPGSGKPLVNRDRAAQFGRRSDAYESRPRRPDGPSFTDAECREAERAARASRETPGMTLHVGPYRYKLVISDTAIFNNEGIELDGLASEGRRLLVLSFKVEPERRREVAMHELRHAWGFHFPAPCGAEEESQFFAAIVEQLSNDLAEQGGEEALMALAPERVQHNTRPKPPRPTYAPIFQNIEGHPVPRLPYSHDGVDRPIEKNSDVLSLDEATRLFGLSRRLLAQIWGATFGEFFDAIQE
jgi:hypothetical protein